MRPRKAIAHAFAGAWVGSLVTAALLCVRALLGPTTFGASIWLKKIAIPVLVLLALTLVAMGLCAIGAERERRD
jgi:hypothetical protein